MEVFVRTNALLISQIVQPAIAILPALLVCKDSIWIAILHYAKLVLPTAKFAITPLLVSHVLEAIF